MFPANFRYHRAHSFAEAAATLAALGADAKPMAGGQTLIPLLKLRLSRPTDIVDLGPVRGGREIGEAAGRVTIGALATHASIGTSGLAARYPILGDCALGIADAQVRNLGTIGGSIAEVDPSSCWPVCLVALDAQAHCVGPAGTRTQPVRELLQDAFTPALGAGELITAIELSSDAFAGRGTFVAFKRAAPAYPTASCALQLAMDGECVAKLRVALGCVGLMPIVVDTAGVLAQGRALDATLIADVAAAAAAACEPIADVRGSEAYKRSLVAGLVRRAFGVLERRRRGETDVQTHFYYG